MARLHGFYLDSTRILVDDDDLYLRDVRHHLDLVNQENIVRWCHDAGTCKTMT